MCSICGKKDVIVGHYTNQYGIKFTIESCLRCKGISHNKT